MTTETPHKSIHMKSYALAALGMLATAAAYAHGISDADKQSMVEGGYLQFIWLGASHMLTGYDHLLFLFGVIFFLDKFKDVVRFITAFTLGHSITLIFATFMKITANYYLVDAVIALTVAYKGFDNIGGFEKFLKMKSPNLIKLVFCFGLIHGFGLSTRLQQLPLGNSGLLLKIISFNIGVELGQIIALSGMVLLLAGWRKTKSFSRFSAASNCGLIAAGALLLLMQLHGYSHEVFVDDLKFSKDSHAHVHAEWEAETELVQVEPPNLDEKGADQTASPDGNSSAPAPDGWKDTVTITVPSGKGLEYKFHLLKGASLEYSWETTGGNLYYDFHGEPKGDTTGYFESYEEKMSNTSTGTLTAPFEGSHGWYWKNNGVTAVQITLKTKGAYDILGLM